MSDEDRSSGDNPFWDGPPLLSPSAADSVAKDPSCQGLIAKALHEALQEMQNEQLNAASDNNEDTKEMNEEMSESDGPDANDQHKKNELQMSPEVVNSILLAFGNRMASNESIPELSHREAPVVLLKGRVEYYNRRNNKWRLAVQDAELRERPMLEKRRRKRERPSLWLVAEEQDKTKSAKFDMELLVYDDIE